MLPPQDPRRLGGPGGPPRGRRHGARPRRPRPALDAPDDLGGAAVRRPAVPRQDLDVCRGHRAARGRGVRRAGSTSGGARSTPGSRRTPHRTCPATSPARRRGSRSDEGPHADARRWSAGVGRRWSPRAPSRAARRRCRRRWRTTPPTARCRSTTCARADRRVAGRQRRRRSGPVVGTVRLDFAADGRVSAETGCNGVHGPASVEDSVLVTGPLMSTRMACEPALMEQERWVTEMLASHPRLELSGPYLALHWGEGEQWWLGLEREGGHDRDRADILTPGSRAATWWVRRGGPDALEPRAGRGEVGVARQRRDAGPLPVGPRVGAEEAHLGADPAQAHQRLADPLVEHVALEVDREAVGAHRLLGRARLEPGHVDAAGGELLEQGEQATGVVVALEQHHGRLVGAGRRRAARRAGRRARSGSPPPACRRCRRRAPRARAAGRRPGRTPRRRRAAGPARDPRRRRRSTGSGTYTASGRCSPIQPRTWAHACEWVPTARTVAEAWCRAGPRARR